MPRSLLVVYVRGTVNIPTPIKDTLRQLHLTRRFRATIIPDNASYRGMMEKVKHYVVWFHAERATVEELLKKRTRGEGRKPLSQAELSKLGFKDFKELAEALCDGRVLLKHLRGVKPFFTLAPPRGGFRRSTKRMHAQGGVLGENPELPKLVAAML